MVRSQVIQSFVARIWLERTEGQEPRWRGHIQHIQGPEEVYFQGLSEVSEFLEKVSGLRGPGFAAPVEGKAADDEDSMGPGARKVRDGK